MTRSRWFVSVFTAVVFAGSMVGYAHFRLIEPTSWIVENERGDPQKSGPCGGSNTDWGKPSYAVTKVIGGSRLHITLQETIYHPGFYRVALAVNSPTELPPDPVATTKDGDRGPISVSGKVDNPPRIPVLADGLFVHNTRPAQGTTMTPWETDVTLPNISCSRCTLQIVQFMEEHPFNNPGGYTYHHCANLQIAADKSKPLDTDWPAERSRSN